MATYKLIQDIEAEDHILGPLSLRQFIFALVAVLCYYLTFIAVVKHFTFFLIITVPPALFFTFFAFPFGRDQPTEVWALAKIRFLLKPRRRIWDQTGMKDLVTITVPKKIEPILTDGLSQNEVRSRLSALANTIDTRGWAVKNVSVNTYAHPNPLMNAPSDRLVDINSMPQEVPSFDTQSINDMLDEKTSPIAQQFDHMISASEQTHRNQLINQLQNSSPTPQQPAQPPANYWFMNQPTAQSNLKPDQAMFSSAQVVSPSSGPPAATLPHKVNPDEAALTAQLKQQSTKDDPSYSHMRTLQPLSNKPAPSPVPVATTPTPAVTAPPDPAILSLANNNDLNVATIARQAHRAKGDDKPTDNEVVISLR